MPEQAAETIESLAFHQEVMAKKEDIAGAIGERSELIRALRSLQVLEAELRGRLALLGPAAGRGSAFNWFRAATDRQLPSRMLTAPPLLTPMATALGDYFLSLKKPAKAVAAYEEALVAFPNDVETLKGLAKAFADSDQPEKASEISRKISALAPE